MCDMPATRTRLLIAIGGLVAALAAIAAVMLISLTARFYGRD
jgi:hypothetical protein